MNDLEGNPPSRADGKPVFKLSGRGGVLGRACPSAEPTVVPLAVVAGLDEGGGGRVEIGRSERSADFGAEVAIRGRGAGVLDRVETGGMLFECAAKVPTGAAEPRGNEGPAAMPDSGSAFCTAAVGAALGRTEAGVRGTLAALDASDSGVTDSGASVLAETLEDFGASDFVEIDATATSSASDFVGIGLRGVDSDGSVLAGSMPTAVDAGSGDADWISSSSSDPPQSSSMSLVAGTND